MDITSYIDAEKGNMNLDARIELELNNPQFDETYGKDTQAVLVTLEEGYKLSVSPRLRSESKTLSAVRHELGHAYVFEKKYTQPLVVAYLPHKALKSRVGRWAVPIIGTALTITGLALEEFTDVNGIGIPFIATTLLLNIPYIVNEYAADFFGWLYRPKVKVCKE